MRSYLLAAVAAATFAVTVSPADAQGRVRAGGLTCRLEPTIGLVVGSRQQARCSFKPVRGPVEYYRATITRVGLDVGIQGRGTLIWGVFAGTSALPPRTLAGTYVGASGEAAIGIGAGANVLVGGSNRSIALQPLSVSGGTGLNVALGVASLRLH